MRGLCSNSVYFGAQEKLVVMEPSPLFRGPVTMQGLLSNFARFGVIEIHREPPKGRGASRHPSWGHKEESPSGKRYIH